MPNQHLNWEGVWLPGPRVMQRIPLGNGLGRQKITGMSRGRKFAIC